MLKTSSIQEKETTIYASLSKAEHLGVQEQCARLKTSSVAINPDQKCEVCKKKIGTAVFACYPNKICVHFRCMSKGEEGKSICPVTKRRFSPMDQIFNA